MSLDNMQERFFDVCDNLYCSVQWQNDVSIKVGLKYEMDFKFIALMVHKILLILDPANKIQVKANDLSNDLKRALCVSAFIILTWLLTTTLA